MLLTICFVFLNRNQNVQNFTLVFIVKINLTIQALAITTTKNMVVLQSVSFTTQVGSLVTTYEMVYLIQPYVKNFGSDLQQVNDFLRVL